MPRRPCSVCRAIFDDPAGRYEKCPQHRRRAWRQHQATRTEHGHEYGAAWRKLRVAVLRACGGRCSYCGKPANTIDAIHPRSRGGQTCASNSTAACSPCNTSKGARTVPEWIASGCAPPGAAAFWERHQRRAS